MSFCMACAGANTYHAPDCQRCPAVEPRPYVPPLLTHEQHVSRRLQDIETKLGLILEILNARPPTENPIRDHYTGHPYCWKHGWIEYPKRCPSCHPGSARPDPGAAEPERAAPAGPVHSGSESERASGSDPGAGGPAAGSHQLAAEGQPTDGGREQPRSISDWIDEASFAPASATDPSKAPASPSKAAAGEAKESGSNTISGDSTTTESSDSQTPEISTATPSPKGPRYEVKAMKKWAEEHPEEAAAIRRDVFGADESSTTEWIRVQNKKRKIKGELREERTRLMADVETVKAAAKAEADRVETHRTAVQPLVDLFQGGARKNARGEWEPDFDAVDAAFEQCTQGLPLDQYMRMRARRGVANPESARMRAENARLQRELEAAKGASAKPAEDAPADAKPAAKPVAPAPTHAELAEKWGDEVPKKHPLRKIEGWAQALEDAMSAYHDEDLDEYSRDPEEVANEVLKAQLAELQGDDDDEEEAPAPRAKPRVKVRGKLPAVGKDGLPDPASLRPKPSKTAPASAPGDDDEPKDFRQRQAWALERHQRRARGELVD
jgi:hypothetical protein